MTGIVNVTITAPSAELLVDLTRSLVEDGIVASGNVIAGATSVYRWDGEIHQAAEAVASLRTQAHHVPAIVEATKRVHPYVTPHVIAMPIVAANPDYQRWVIKSTGGASG